MKRLLLACTVLALGACGDGEAVRAPCPAGQLCFETGNGPDPISLDPHKTQGTWETRILTDMLIGLTTDDAKGQVMPGMAQTWETSPDGLTWTFHLRDAVWSDGVPVTADDFVFSLQRILDPATASEYATLLYFIKGAQPVNESKAKKETLGVRAIDPKTLEIRLEHPAPYLLELAKHQTMFPVPKHAIEKWGEAWSQPANYVANGPYIPRSWRLGDRVSAVKNPKFYDAANVCIDQVNYYVSLDAASSERRIIRGEFDHVSDGSVTSNRLARLREKIPEYVHSNTYLGTSYLAFNGKIAKLQDPRVRQALTMAIDRDFVTGKLLRGGQVPAYTFVPPGVANYVAADTPYWQKLTYEQRQAEARRLLAEAGYGPGNPLKVEITHRNSADPTLVMPAIQADWKAIGVEATLIANEVQIAYQAYRTGDFEIADAGWIADYNDAMSFLYLMNSSTGAMNYGQYNNPTYDALLLQADNEPDVKTRADILRRAEEIMQKDAPVASLWYTINKNLVNPRVTGFYDNIADHHPTRFLCFKDAKKAAP